MKKADKGMAKICLRLVWLFKRQQAMHHLGPIKNPVPFLAYTGTTKVPIFLSNVLMCEISLKSFFNELEY